MILFGKVSLDRHGSDDRSIVVVFVVIVTMLMEMKKHCPCPFPPSYDGITVHNMISKVESPY